MQLQPCSDPPHTHIPPYFRWAAATLQGRYLFIAKADSDLLINPYLLRLMLSELAEREWATV